MGRYYSGDIEGKFWFAVQNSNAADRFGVEGVEQNYLVYNFDEDHLDTVQTEIKLIEDTIGLDNISKLEEFFGEGVGYSDKTLEAAGLLEIWSTYKEDYADLFLGRKIEKCLIENGQCNFDAEL